jgi:hypothetical protein
MGQLEDENQIIELEDALFHAGSDRDKMRKEYTAALKKIRTYEHALVNIVECNGQCWDVDGRLCHDASAVANAAIKKANPGLSWLMDNNNYTKFSVVKKTGLVKFMKYLLP